MSQIEVDHSSYNNDGYNPGGYFRRFIWYFCNALFLLNPLNPFNFLRIVILKLFGANIGRCVVIKQRVNVKYPWNLEIGDYSWIGEKVWIDNLDMVKIGDNVCISQGAMIVCGSHNYRKSTFDLIVKPIMIENGVWIGALCTICPGIICKTHSMLTMNSVATTDLEPYMIYQGNPAKKLRDRVMLE